MKTETTKGVGAKRKPLAEREKDQSGYRIETKIVVTRVRSGYNGEQVVASFEMKKEPEPTLDSAAKTVDSLVKQGHREVLASLKFEASEDADKPADEGDGFSDPALN